MSFSYVFGKMLSLAIMMMLGFAAQRGGVLCSQSNRDLSSLVANITTPCMMLASLSATDATRSDLVIMLTTGTALCAFLIAVAELVPKHLPVGAGDPCCVRQPARSRGRAW